MFLPGFRSFPENPVQDKHLIDIKPISKKRATRPNVVFKTKLYATTNMISKLTNIKINNICTQATQISLVLRVCVCVCVCVWLDGLCSSTRIQVWVAVVQNDRLKKNYVKVFPNTLTYVEVASNTHFPRCWHLPFHNIKNFPLKDLAEVVFNEKAPFSWLR